MELESTNLYDLYSTNQEIKILEKELHTLQDEYIFIKEICEKYDSEYIRLSECFQFYGDSTLDGEMLMYTGTDEHIKDYFNYVYETHLQNYKNKEHLNFLVKRIKEIQIKIIEQKSNFSETITKCQNDLNTKLLKIQNEIDNSDSTTEIKKLFRDKDELNKINKELGFINGLYKANS